MAHENQTIVELIECFMNDQRVILRAVVMNAIEKAIQNGMSPEDVKMRSVRSYVAGGETDAEEQNSYARVEHEGKVWHVDGELDPATQRSRFMASMVT